MAFPLFSLPAELRLQIYTHALAPTGTLTLSSTKTKRHSVTPVITLNLLRASRQVRHEASSILYTDNTVLITADCHDTCWPIISDRRLPPSVRARLEHLMLVCVCAGRFRAEYQDVDFAALESLTSLKTLEVAVVKPNKTPPLDLANLLQEILSRVPKSASIRFYSGVDLPSAGRTDFLSNAISEAARVYEATHFLNVTLDPSRRVHDTSCFAIPSGDLHQSAMQSNGGVRRGTTNADDSLSTPSSVDL